MNLTNVDDRSLRLVEHRLSDRQLMLREVRIDGEEPTVKRLQDSVVLVRTEMRRGELHAFGCNSFRNTKDPKRRRCNCSTRRRA